MTFLAQTVVTVWFRR